MHPIIRQELIRQLSPEDYNLPYVMLVSPLLLETNQHELVERIVVVDVPEETQINRTMARDGNSREQVERILAAQMPRAARREKADAIINNAQPLGLVEVTVQALHQRFLADFSQGA